MTAATEDKARVIESINPATLEVNAEIPVTPVVDLKAIVESARDAQAAWAQMKFHKRLNYLHKVKEYLLSHIDETAKIITLDNGKSLVEAVNSEIYPVLDMFRFCEKDAGQALRNEKVRNAVFPIARIESVNIFEPLGVIGIISPWNFPFAIPVTQILMALIAGNTVVFKPAALTAYVGDWIRRLFEAGGLPDGAVNVVQGEGAVIGEAMMEAGLNRVVFTGSVPVGKHLMKKASETLTPITLELGGKDPFIVLDDADIGRASSAAVWGAFVNAGQTCASVERVYVDEKIAERFTDEVAAKTRRLRVGNGLNPDTDVGPMISEERIRTVEAHIADAVRRGARILAGGKRVDNLPGYFFEPTVLTGVNHSMDCMKEETFGPTLPIMPFTSEEEAVELANDSKYGLTASVWSRDLARAKSVGRRIVTGTVVINNCLLTYGFSQCPWGGVKQSGIGRTHSAHGLYEFTNIKNVTASKPVFKEDPWWYPYSEIKYRGVKAAIKTLFCEGILCKAGGAVDAVKSLNRTKGKA